MKGKTFALASALVAEWAVFSRLYILVRYGVRWTEWDTGYVSMNLKHSLTVGNLAPTYFPYTNGVGYQALSVPAIYLSGLSVFQYQVILSPILGLIPLSVLYVLFRKVTGN